MVWHFHFSGISIRTTTNHLAAKQRSPLLAPALQGFLPFSSPPPNTSCVFAPSGLQWSCLIFTILNTSSKNLSNKCSLPHLPPLCGAYPPHKHTTFLPSAGLPRSPHKCASLARNAYFLNLRSIHALIRCTAGDCANPVFFAFSLINSALCAAAAIICLIFWKCASTSCGVIFKTSPTSAL